MATQLKIIYGCCALLNFMLLNGERLDSDMNGGGDDLEQENDAVDNRGRARGMALSTVRNRVKRKRDQIAVAMHNQYQETVQRRTRTARRSERGRR